MPRTGLRQRATAAGLAFSPDPEQRYLFNENVILSENTGYGLQWLTPYETMGGRLFKFSTQFEF